MFKRIFVLVPILLLLGTLSSVPSLFAEEITNKNDAILKVRNYIEDSVFELNKVISSLSKEQDNINLQKIEEVVDNYYAENPTPKELIANYSLTIDDVYPLEIKGDIQEKNNLDFVKLISDVKENPNKGDSVYEFTHNNGEVTVYIAKTGEIMILDRSIVPTIDTNNQISATTRRETTTATAYNVAGGKLFTVWAEGSFEYDGTSATHAFSDGDYNRHFWGSTMVITPRYLGRERIEAVGDYRYPEVASRLYIEAQFGIRWAGVTMDSGTVEVYVGSTPTGSLYGGARRILPK